MTRARLATLILPIVLSACSEDMRPGDQLNFVPTPIIPRVVSAHEALDGAYTPAIDPATMRDVEVARALGSTSFCSFRYMSAGNPVLAVAPQASVGSTDGVVKLNGSLVLLKREVNEHSLALAADPVHLYLTFSDSQTRPASAGTRPREAELVFEVGRRLRVGYSGYYNCRAPLRSRA
jgi:hypothetical protein